MGRGHTIAGKLALYFMNKEAREAILKVLNGMPIDIAANWMEIMKSNADYDFMRSWHYIDFDKGKTYKPLNIPSSTLKSKMKKLDINKENIE